MKLSSLLLLALLSSACECECVTGPTAQPEPSCSIPVLTVELAGRTVVGSWQAADVRLTIEEESGSPGNWIPLQLPGNLSTAADGFRWTAAKDGRYRFTARTGCGQSVRVVLIDTAPVPEPPDPPKQPEGPMPCVAGMRPNPGC